MRFAAEVVELDVMTLILIEGTTKQLISQDVDLLTNINEYSAPGRPENECNDSLLYIFCA